eukprot:g726.t1
MDIDELNDRLSALKSIIWDGVEEIKSILKRIVKYLIESRIDRKYIDVSFVREAFHSVDAGRTGRVDRDTFFTVVREILHWNIETKPLDDICKLTCVASENVIDYTTFQAAFATLKCVPSTPKVAALSRASMAAREAKWSSSSPSSSSASPPLTKTTMSKRLTSEKEFEGAVASAVASAIELHRRGDSGSVDNIPTPPSFDLRMEEAAELAGQHVRMLLEATRENLFGPKESDTVRLALTDTLIHGHLDPLCEILLRVERQCLALREENGLLRSVVEDLRVGAGELEKRSPPASSLATKRADDKLSWSEKLKSRRRKKAPRSESKAKNKAGRLRRRSTNTRMRSALLGRFFGQKKQVAEEGRV